MLYFESDSKSNPLRIRSWVYDPEGHARMVQLVKDKINEIFAS